jgi:hypothetical protein
MALQILGNRFNAFANTIAEEEKREPNSRGKALIHLSCM